jgi:tripartite-type tricarboxylate transporter receptor subunit TctC
MRRCSAMEDDVRLSRRDVVALIGGAAALPAATRVALAQNYPDHPARVMAGFPPGGISDTYARLVAQWLSQQLGQQFIVENRPGAGGTLAAETVAKSAPDGYTLLLTTSADAWNQTLYQNLNYDIIRDFAPVATISRGAGLFVVNPSFPVKSIPELIAYAKANPGKATIASAGVGSAPHMYWELFRTKTGVDMVHVPYRGAGPAVVDLLGGQVQAYFGTFAASIEQVRAGKLRALGVSTPTRAAVLPDVPAIAEFIPGFEASIYVGIAAPRSTPPAIVDKLSTTIGNALDDPGVTRRIAELGDAPLKMSSAAFTRLVADETEKWAQVIHVGGVKAE